ncbi:MAG: universal stress protein [Frankiaceae bacterium]|jgi:nucleotide-binding universal stress UspA family protein|nr:universal stress protein [Frankiaceae bacterium]
MTDAPQTADTRPVVVVGMDGSPAGRKAGRWAIRYAEKMGARLKFVAAWQSLSRYGAFGYLPDSDSEIAERTRSSLLEEVAELLGEALPEDCEVTASCGNPAQVLIKHSVGAHCLVVGSRGHAGLAGVVLGSVSAECAAHAKCPVVVVHGGDQIDLAA